MAASVPCMKKIYFATCYSNCEVNLTDDRSGEKQNPKSLLELLRFMNHHTYIHIYSYGDIIYHESKYTTKLIFMIVDRIKLARLV